MGIHTPKKAHITTHILNLEMGKPASNVAVNLYSEHASDPIAKGVTDSDGRILQWDNEFEIAAGHYRLQFAVGAWYAQQKLTSFYPEISIQFTVASVQEHYHVPLLLNAFGYSTYRGS